jgi:hypothetical protein
MAKVIWRDAGPDSPIFHGGFVISSYRKNNSPQVKEPEEIKTRDNSSPTHKDISDKEEV